MTIKAEERAARAAERAARAEERAAKAVEAEEAARLAEEAAAKAREAARLAQIAAEEAAAAEKAEEDSAEEPEAPSGGKSQKALKSSRKSRRSRKAAEAASEEDAAAAEDSEASEAVSVDTEAVEGAESDADEDTGAEDADAEDADAKAEDADAGKAEAAETDAEADEDDESDDVSDEDDGDEEAKASRLRFRKAAKASAAADDEPRGWFRVGSLSTVLAVLVVLTIALGAGTTALALKLREQNATEEASKQGALAASRAAQKLSTYDYQTLDADLKAASATTTGKLHTQYDKLAQQLRTVAVQQQAVSNTTVIKTGVVSATPDKVVALVYANRSSATKNDKQQRLPEPLRIKMTMVKKDGKWLASELTVLS
ncbi:hypothetical protein [Actinomadura sp. B10D3]|uniref:hypothetical protein n=1 Tax=Actinomadura sp. B10D3 TaxID=3153557 RepID=UPI00325E7619